MSEQEKAVPLPDALFKQIARTPLLSAEDAKRLIDVSGWFAVSPPHIRAAIKAIASSSAVVIPASELARLREVEEWSKELAADRINYVRKCLAYEASECVDIETLRAVIAEMDEHVNDGCKPHWNLVAEWKAKLAAAIGGGK